jgi:PilZ domain
MSYATSEMRFFDYATAALEDRSAPRFKLEIPARLRPSGITGFSVIVTDLSLSGFACEAVSGIPVGSRCWLTLPDLGALQADVVRNDGQIIGCAFTNVLNQAILDSIIGRFGVAIPF